MEHTAIPVPPEPEVLAGIPAPMLADTIERLLAELDARDLPLVEDTPMFPDGAGYIDLGDDLPGDAEDAEEEPDRCGAYDDAGTTYVSYVPGAADGRPGDPTDAEANGDEKDGNNAEDEHLFGGVCGLMVIGEGPGCPVTDAGEYAYPEWHTLGRHKGSAVAGSLPHEDAEEDDAAEDDDPGGGNVTDEPHDGHDEGGPELSAWPERINQTVYPASLDAWHGHGALVHEDAEDDDQDACLAADDDPKRRLQDGLPGDRLDTELNGDESDANGDEGDYSGYWGEG